MARVPSPPPGDKGLLESLNDDKFENLRTKIGKIQKPKRKPGPDNEIDDDDDEEEEDCVKHNENVGARISESGEFFPED